MEFLGIERVEQSAPGVKNKVFEDGVGESGKKMTPAQITFDELSLRYPGCQLVESRLAPLLSDSVDAVEFSRVNLSEPADTRRFRDIDVARARRSCAEWQDGEVLALGTSPRGDITRVFLGSRGTKIMRHSPVPVLVLPG